MVTINVELEESLSATEVIKIKDLLLLIRGITRVTGDESYQLAALNAPEPRRNMVPPQRPQQDIELENLDLRQKKHIISQAIAWGSKQGKITLNILEGLSPEEMLSLATQFLSEMSDSEKDAVFKEMT